MLALAGCDTRVAANSSNLASQTGSSQSTTIEAGVVLANRSGYLCLPLEQVGLSPDTSILSLHSSCECIQPSLVEYHNGPETTAQAILLEYIDESAGAHSDLLPSESNRSVADLGVVVEATLADGSLHGFTVNVLQSYLKVARSSPP